MERTDLTHLAARIAPWSRTFALGVGPDAWAEARDEADQDPLGAVYPCSDIVRVPSGAAARIVALHQEVRGMPPARFAASLAFQRYAHRVAGVATAIWFTTGLVAPVTAERTWLVVAKGTPQRILVPEPVEPAAGDADALVSTVVDGHLLPAACAFHDVSGMGMPNLWGNIGAAFGAACQNLAEHAPAEAVRVAGRAILDARPRLRASGEFCLLDGPAGPRLFFERRSCCHWHDVSGKNCAWCSDLGHDEHVRRFRARLSRA